MKSTNSKIWCISFVIYYFVFVFHQYSQKPLWNWNCHLCIGQKNSSIQIYHEWLCFRIAKNAIQSNSKTKINFKSRFSIVYTILKCRLHIYVAEGAHFIEYIHNNRPPCWYLRPRGTPILLHAHFGCSSQCNADSTAARRSVYIKITHSMARCDDDRLTDDRVYCVVASRSCTTTR